MAEQYRLLRIPGRSLRIFSADSVFAACRQALESNFVPSYLQVVSEIPKTASEKPQERFLLAEFARDAANVFTEGR